MKFINAIRSLFTFNADRVLEIHFKERMRESKMKGEIMLCKVNDTSFI
jgi:hypothetical protein